MVDQEIQEDEVLDEVIYDDEILDTIESDNPDRVLDR